MKTFVYDAIKDRLLKRIKLNADSATILDDSAFTNILDVVSEGLAETARYGEYLYLEKKWDTAKNISSLLAMGSLIGRKRQRPESSTGVIIVSHSDNEGKNRLINYGKYFFDIDESSNYDNIEKEENANYIKQKSLVPWTSNSLYTIPEGTEFTSSTGISFFSTKSVKIKTLEKKYSEISSNESTLKEFLSAGGWDGIKYLKVPVIQGKRRTAKVGKSTGARNQTFKFEAENIEAGNNNISKKYFYITVTEKDGTETTWFEVPMIQLAGPYDRVFETELSADGSYIKIKFGNGYSGRIPNNNAEIVLYYIETAGAKGNIEQKFQVNSIKFPTGYEMIDPRTKTEREFLSCLNVTPILGGKGIETRDEYRENAPSTYLKYYATSVKSNYEKKIYEESPYSLLNAKCFISSNFIGAQLDNSIDYDIEEEVINQMSLISNSLNITAIKSNGDKMNDIEAKYFIDSLSESLSEIKGPNDALSYCEPNLIKMAPSVLIKTSDLAVTESNIKDKISKIILSQYSIFNTDFKKEFISSKIIYLSSLYDFTDSVECFIDCFADIDIDNTIFQKYGTGGLILVPFQFSNVFSNDKFKKGFKNFKDGKKFNLRVDLKSNNDSSVKERTLLLVDNRELNSTDVQTGKTLAVNSQAIPSKTTVKCDELNENIYLFNEESNSFNNRQIRVAQFPLLSNKVFTNEFIDTLFGFENTPSEIRPLEQDNTGQNKVVLSNSIETNDRVATQGTQPGEYCYKRNNDYISNFDIIYYERFNDMDDYAYGYLVMPSKYFENGVTARISSDGNNSEYIESVKRFLKDNMDIQIRAEPRADTITPLNWNEIVFVDDDDIVVEKEVKLSE